MGLSASQGRMLLLTARKNDLEFRAQQISQKRLILSQQLEGISLDYEEATSNRVMSISLNLSNDASGLNNTYTKANLTYANLISGTLEQFGPEDSGIKKYSRTENQEYTSSTAYRLVDAYDNIVVSSVEEIPGSISSTSTVATEKNEQGIYQSGKYDNSGKIETVEGNYIVIPKNADGKDSDLSKALSGKDAVKQNLDVDIVNGLVAIVDSSGSAKYYDYKTGMERTGEEFDSKGFKATMVDNAYSVPTSTKTVTENAQLQIGTDGKYNLIDSKGGIIAKYVVDETLKRNSSDTTGSTVDGPNYLQDCIRNGKYLVQKGGVNSDTNKIQWRNVSWDATSNIADSYYIDDDDKAKAKYDRLQNQIQNQDKKLELELDNIETQRKAVTTEVDSVQKVMDDNIDSTFKTFA